MSLNYTKFIDSCVKNDIESVKLLLKSKLHYINQTIITGDTCLHIAAGRNYKELCLTLIEYGIDINLQNMNGKTALMKAVKNGKTEIVKLLLCQQNIDVNKKDLIGNTALILGNKITNNYFNTLLFLNILFKIKSKFKISF